MGFTAFGPVGSPPVILTPHTVDADTVAHWEFNGDGVSDPAGNDMLTGNYIACPIEASNTKSGMAVSRSAPFRINTYSAALDNSTWTTPSMTLAACVWFDSFSESADLLRHEIFAGGQAHWRWRCLSDGRVGMSLDTVAGFVTSASIATIPLNTWTWVAVTMNADGKSGVFRIGGVQESWSIPNPSNITSTSTSITPMDAWNTNPGKGCMYSLIMKDIAATSLQLDAMKSQTGL